MIVITGAGIVSALGVGLAENTEALLSGQCGLRPVRYLNTKHRDYPVGEVQLSNEELAARLGIEAEDRSRTVLLGAVALREALAEAGLDGNTLEDTALISGTAVGTMDVAERTWKSGVHADVGDCGVTTEEIAALCGKFEFRATCSTACSSSANAFILGANLLRSGLYSRVVVGGSECLSRYHFNGFRSLMILDHEPCRPFDATRAGLNLGEGAAYVVMEMEAGAVARGVKPLAVLSGWGNACDAYHQTASSEEGEGAFLAMTKALEKARIKTGDIGYVNAHGTGTPNNDESEYHAMRRLFGTALPPVSSTKAMTGHTTAASGGIEAVFCLAVLQNSFIPKNLRWKEPMTEDFAPVTETLRDRTLNHILCNSFGFGGNCTSLVLSAYHPGEGGAEVVALRPVYMRSVLAANRIPEAEVPKIPVMVARRLSGVLKRALTTSMAMLQRVGVPHPDAIVTATPSGCVRETEAFLEEIATHGEELLKPTNFMQSTHNTIGSLIAIHTHNTCYNNTFSQGKRSFFTAFLDAYLLVGLGEAENALVGLHDELEEDANCVFISSDGRDALSTMADMKKLKRLCGDCCR